MTLRFLPPNLPPSLCAAALLTLAGCGGDPAPTAAELVESSESGAGRGGTVIDTRNGPGLARDTLALATSLQDLADVNYVTLTGAAVDTARHVPDVVTFAYRQLRQWADAPIPGGGSLGGVVITETFPCEGGGSLTVEFDDADSNDRLTTGDGAVFTFRACAAEGVITDGRIGYSDIELSGPAGAPTGIAARFDYTRFRVIDAGIETSVDGTARYRVAVTTVEPAPLALEATALVPQLTYSSTDGWGYTLTGVDFRSETDYGRSTYRFRLAGTIGTASIGALEVETQAPFEGSLGQVPTSGRLAVRAADGSAVRLTALGVGSVRLEVDTDGDGRPESNATVRL